MEEKKEEVFDTEELESEPKLEPESSPEPEKPLEKKVPKLSPLVRRMAREAGLSDDDIADSSPEEVREYIKDLSVARILQTRNEAVSSPPQVAPVAQEVAKGELGFDANHLDDDLVNFLRAKSREIQELKGQISSLIQTQQASSSRTMTQRLDAVFNQYTQLYGSGPGTRMDKKSPEYARRMAVIAYLNSSGDRETPIEEQVVEATQTLYGSKSKDKAEEWSGSGLARPTRRTGSSEPEGREKAIARIRSMQGGNSQALAVNELDEFLS